MSNLCIIPARGGSKRIPKKNIKHFGNKPIIAYSIEAALSSGLFDKVIVTTDDHDIVKIAQYYGAETPFIRPEHLSDDFTNTSDVITHAITSCETYYNMSFNIVCCLYATAPFIKNTDLKNAYEGLIKANTNFVVPVTNFPFPIQRALKQQENLVVPFCTQNMKKRSQDLEEAFHDAGQFYMGYKSAWHTYPDIWSANISPLILSRYAVQDIDTMEDWDHAELLYALINQKISDKLPA